MLTTPTEPIPTDWTIETTPTPDAAPATGATPTASQVNALLARFEASDLSPSIAPLLAAAAAELAALVGVVWRFRSDEPAVASLRMIARAASRRPDARGPDTARLVRRIESGSV